jgi:hypothetical protein
LTTPSVTMQPATVADLGDAEDVADLDGADRSLSLRSGASMPLRRAFTSSTAS